MSHTHLPQHPTSRTQVAVGVLACSLAIWGISVGLSAQAQTSVGSPSTKTPAAAAKTAASAPQLAVKTSSAKATKPEWQDLSPAQQTALKPLVANWQTMSPGHKNKWIELSKNYATLPAAEQTKLHNRMAAWASLSPQQREQARLNFAEHQVLTQGLTPEQRRVQWQAYQLLSPEEKKKLAASSPKPPVGTATAVRPADPLKNSPPPQFGTAQVLGKQAEQPGRIISVAPHLQQGNRLLPQSSIASSATTTATPPAR
jgi:Protein of unknown function (DUF3106)